MKEWILKRFEDVMRDVESISWIALLSFTIGLIILLMLPNIYREAGLAGGILVGASLILVKLFIVRK